MRALGLFLLLACSTESGNRCDLGGAVANPDLAPVAHLCAGGALAGTCVEAFFGDAAGCFVPSGACVSRGDDQSGVGCWASGAKMERTSDATSLHVTWSQNGAVCLTSSAPVSGDQPALYTRGGQTLSISSTGKVVCPDGTTLDIGAGGLSACDAVVTTFFTGVTRCAQGSCC